MKIVDPQSQTRHLVCSILLAGSLLGATASVAVGFQFESRIESAAACSAAEVRLDVAALPLVFSPNRGQSLPGIAFEARSIGSAALLLRPRGGLELILDELDGLPPRTLRWSFPRGAGAIEPGAPAMAEASYLLGDDPGRWIADLPTYRTVLYRGLFDGVDLAYRGDGQRLGADFTVAPGADPSRIRWRLAGLKPDRLTLRDGRLAIRLDADGDRSAFWLAPRAWQSVDGERLAVEVAYRLDGLEIAFQLGSYDPSRPLHLVAELIHSPYFDRYQATAGDNGPIYLAASTPAPAPSRSRAPQRDAMVVRVDRDGGEILSLTVIGGRGDDRGSAIALTAMGDLLVAGETRSRDFPIVEAIQSEPGGGDDGFLLLLSANGSTLLRSTYHGGPGDDSARALTVAADGLYLVGKAGAGFPAARPEAVSVRAFFPKNAGGARQRVFVSRLSHDASELLGVTQLAAGRTLGGLKAWTSCDREEVFVGVDFGIEPRALTGRALPSCLLAGTGDDILAPRALACGYGLDTYKISVSASFSTCPEIGQGWGYHAFCWKSREFNRTYSAPASGMPTGTVSGSDSGTLNSLEGNTAIWPQGNPPGSWFGRSSKSAAELAVGAAISIDRWSAPSYSNLAGVDRRVGIKQVVFDIIGSSVRLRSLCSTQGWSTNSTAEDVAARNCINEHGGVFILSSVKYDWWDDESFHTDTTDNGQTFGANYTQFEPWVSDPPDAVEAARIEDAARRLRHQIFVRIDADGLEETLVVEGTPQRRIATRGEGPRLLVRLDDLGE